MPSIRSPIRRRLVPRIPNKVPPIRPSHKHVHISSDVNVVFNNSFSACSQGAWQLTPDANSGDLFLSTGGGIGNPSPQTAANWFKIEKRRGDPGFYQLEYCPSSNTIDAFATKKDIVCGAIDGSIDNLTDDHRMILVKSISIRPDDYFSTGLMFFFIKA
uniref:Uncharacterized protein n=1 Tax=Chenopodium quinoa TaxID=63459 RepID=A0A803NDH5_CHEQI